MDLAGIESGSASCLKLRLVLYSALARLSYRTCLEEVGIPSLIWRVLVESTDYSSGWLLTWAVIVLLTLFYTQGWGSIFIFGLFTEKARAYFCIISQTRSYSLDTCLNKACFVFITTFFS